MPVELKVPAVGESITEVEIGEWLKKVGDSLHKDESVVMIETDKVTVELAAPCSGTVVKILKEAGQSAEVGEVIGVMEQGEVSTETSPAPPAQAQDGPSKEPVNEPYVMPAAKRALHDAKMQPQDVVPTGPGGRILKEDVLKAASTKKDSPLPATVPKEQGYRGEEVIPMTSLRRRIAKRLVAAQQNAALLTTFNEVDMSSVMALRSRYKEDFIGQHGVKLGFMSFFVKAAVEALKKIPALNAQLKGDDIIYRHYCDVGIAVGGGKGLVVPVLRNAEALGFAEIEASIRDFAKRAQVGKLTLEDLSGGTFTISNGGVYGSMLSTPIVNPPQSGILGLHAIKDRPTAVKGEVKIRPIMYLALSYDHRIVDGREAVTFLSHIKDTIEDPARILLEL
jgi:2-oxoglutarate dehydrogenase E2 component (dihydrolipoamide succinyltransferase)